MSRGTVLSLQMLALGLLLQTTDVRFWLDPRADLDSWKWKSAISAFRLALLTAAAVVFLFRKVKRPVYTALIASLCVPLSGLLYRRSLQRFAPEPVEAPPSITQAYALAPTIEKSLNQSLQLSGPTLGGLHSSNRHVVKVANLHLTVTDWTGTVPQGQKPLSGWRGTLDQLEWMETHVLECRFANAEQTEWQGLARIEASGLLPGSKRSFLTGKLKMIWTLAATGWQMKECSAESMTAVEGQETWFEEVMGQAIPDSARDCPYERQIVAALRGKSRSSVSMSAGYKRRPSIQVVDIDGDGWDDLFCTRRSGPCLLLRNQRDGKFRECAAEWGLDLPGPAFSALFADFDNDGDPDLVLGLASGLTYYRAEGGRYKPIGQAVTAVPEVSSLAAADVNQDGLLDFYAATFGSQSGNMRAEPRPDYLFINSGKHFKAQAVSQKKSGGSAQVLFAHLDPASTNSSTYVSSYSAPDRAWTEMPPRTAPSTVQGFQTSGLGASSADADQDGLLDLFLSEPELNLAEYVLYASHRKGRAGSSIYWNRAGKLQRDMLNDFSACDWPTGSQFVDFNQDGLPDLYMPCGFYTAPRLSEMHADPRGLLISKRSPQRNHAFLNLGERKFLPVTGLSGADLLPDPRGLVPLDYNHDGMPDLALVNLQRPFLQLLKNKLQPAPVLAVTLKGGNHSSSASKFSNRDGIGSLVYVKGTRSSLVQELRAGEGYGSQNSLVLLFGLAGNSDSSYHVEVLWPSGRRQNLAGVKPGEHLKFEERTGTVVRGAYR